MGKSKFREDHIIRILKGPQTGLSEADACSSMIFSKNRTELTPSRHPCMAGGASRRIALIRTRKGDSERLRRVIRWSAARRVPEQTLFTSPPANQQSRTYDNTNRPHTSLEGAGQTYRRSAIVAGFELNAFAKAFRNRQGNSSLVAHVYWNF